MNYQSKPFSNWLRDLLYQFLGLLAFALLISAGYKYKAYSERVRYAKSLEGKIVEADCNGDKRRLTNGALVWVTGHLSSHRPLQVELFDGNDVVFGQYIDTVLWMRLSQMQIGTGRYAKWHLSYEDTLTNEGAYLGVMHVAPDLLSHGMRGSLQVYYKELSRCKVFVHVRPNSDISMIARWQDGALRRTFPDAPLAYVLRKAVPPAELLKQFKKEAWETFEQPFLYLLLVVALLFLNYWCFSRRRQDEYGEQDAAFTLDVRQRINQLRLFRRLILFLLFVISLLLLLGYMHIREDLPVLIYERIHPRFLLCNLMMDVGFVLMLSFAIGIFFNIWYAKRYKQTVLRQLVEQRSEHITMQWKGELLTNDDIRQLDFLGTLPESRGIFNKVSYATHCEDAFFVQAFFDENMPHPTRDFSFFECTVEKIKGRGKNAETTSLFQGLVLKIEIMEKGHFSFHIVPTGSNDQTGMRHYPLHEDDCSKNFNCYCNDPAKMDRVLSSSAVLNTLDGVSQMLRQMPDCREVIYILLDGTLHVIIRMKEDCFEQYYLTDVKHNDIERDKKVVDTLCEAGKCLSALVECLPEDMKAAEPQVKRRTRPKWIPVPKSAEALAREAEAAERDRIITAQRDAREGRRRRRAAIIATIFLAIVSVILLLVTGRLQRDQEFARIEDETGIYEGPTHGHITGTEWTGVGRYTYTRDKDKGTIYLGEFRDSRFNGLGRLTVSPSDGYVGQMTNGHPAGHGMRYSPYSIYWGESNAGGMGVWYSVAGGKYYLSADFGLSTDANCNHQLSDSVVVVLPRAKASLSQEEKRDAVRLQAVQCLKAARRATAIQHSTDSMLRSHYKDYRPYQPQIQPNAVFQQLENLLQKGKSR